jgi:hypothetical protein
MFLVQKSEKFQNLQFFFYYSGAIVYKTFENMLGLPTKN